MKKNVLFLAILMILSMLSSCKTSSDAGKQLQADNSTTSTKEQPVLTNKKWKLVELNGNSIEKTEAFIMFNNEGRINGNSGCNTFMGGYELQEGNRIRFTQVAATLRMCMDATVEPEFLGMIEMVDNYNLTADKLVLNRARMAPLARFEAVAE